VVILRELIEVATDVTGEIYCFYCD
jgi:hypothetical protein